MDTPLLKEVKCSDALYLLTCPKFLNFWDGYQQYVKVININPDFLRYYLPERNIRLNLLQIRLTENQFKIF